MIRSVDADNASTVIIVFTTHEKIEEPVFQVQKRSGTMEPYDRNKALRSIPYRLFEETSHADGSRGSFAERGGKILSTVASVQLALKSLAKRL